jgi:hypothetical protein
MSINLLRNSKVFFTTNVDTAAPNLGRVKASGHTINTTFEIQVLDDLSFSQTTAVETIAVNETGETPIRGQRTFNTALNPVDFNFTTYVRPRKATAGDEINCEESVLWNAMFASDAIGGTNPAWIPGDGTTPAVAQLIHSAKHQLQSFGLIVIFDQNMFFLDDCSLNTATIDFGIDAIASIQWSGQARAIRRVSAPTITAATTSGGSGTFTGGGFTGTNNFTGKLFDAPFIANKLSTVKLVSGIGQYSDAASDWVDNLPAGTEYIMPLTAGSITFTNNITYLTPAYMGTINQPITYFTGSRSITGSLTAYLRKGSGADKYSADLFSDLLAQVNTDSDPQFYLSINLGAASPTSLPRLEISLPGSVLTIPTVNAESVITTTVNFTAQGTDQSALPGSFDILKDNEALIKYFA